MLAGLVLMPVPGPGGTPVFLAGLALLASEDPRAARLLARFKAFYAGMGRRRRAAFAACALAFYVASGFAVWQWTARPPAAAPAGGDGA